jgi:hypothetical protein
MFLLQLAFAQGMLDGLHILNCQRSQLLKQHLMSRADSVFELWQNRLDILAFQASLLLALDGKLFQFLYLIVDMKSENKYISPL